MDLQEVLHTIAEIAVTLAGFSGVVIVFIAGRERWGAREIASLAVMIRASFVAMFLSFVPIVLWQMGYEQIVWNVSAAIIAATQSVSISLFVWQTKWVNASPSQKIYFYVGVVVILVSIGAATNFVPNPAVIVILALLWSVFIATHNFWLLLTVGLKPDDQ